MSLACGEEVVFEHHGHRLAGTALIPEDGAPPYPAVVVVHGSGAVDRDGADGSLVPLKKHFAAQGFVLLSYDKPGVGRSTGDWAEQDFTARADEAVRAVGWLAAHPAVDASRVGLWGISQAGWVAPLAARPDSGIAFVIMVSAATITPHEQATWLAEHELRCDGFGDADIARALALIEERSSALARGADARAVLAAEERELAGQAWYPRFASTPEEAEFITTIWEFDPLPALERLTCPVLAVWGGRDIHMPVRRCAAIMANALSEAGNRNYLLRIFPDADHRIRTAAGEFAPGYLETMTHWLRTSVSYS